MTPEFRDTFRSSEVVWQVVSSDTRLVAIRVKGVVVEVLVDSAGRVVEIRGRSRTNPFPESEMV